MLAPSRRYGAASLLSVESDAKTIKGAARGYLTGIVYLAPGTVARTGRDLCPAARACREFCLYKAGHGVMNSVQRARIARTRFYVADPEGFKTQLASEIRALQRKARRRGLRPAVRVNGTSDQYKLAAAMVAMFPTVRFYDYTKLARPWQRTRKNYHLTYSADGTCNHAGQRAALRHGINVAVVFNTPRGRPLPRRYLGARVVDGDTHDLTFLRPRGVVIGLRAKGPARRAAPAFVIAA
ncbi:MAG: GP88 family protein [Planctomycetota bacterium]|jgi:hypothetical protein